MAYARWSDEGMVLGSLIEDRGFERKEFADLLGITTDVLSNMVRGITELKGERRRKAALALGLTEDGLLDELRRNRQKQLNHKGFNPNPYTNLIQKESAGKPVEVFRAGFRNVPVYGSVPAGPPSTSFSDAVEIIEMPEWGGDFDRWGRVITGESMMDEFLPRDVVIFESRGIDPNMGVYAWKDGEDTFKIYTHGPKGAELRPTNPDFESFSAEGWEIFGVAIMRYRQNEFGGRDSRPYPYGYTYHFPRS
ncbi:MAG TPA: XRE family transcriptional regulator [Fimbriimonas sp.]|nr:XRE family transcriptional regulator [Fimbriimonas sp.]